MTLLNRTSIDPLVFKALLASDLKDVMGGKGTGTHVRASEATYVDAADDLVKSAATNIPRYETVGSLAAILLEPAGTNLCTHSEAFRAAISGWANTRCSVTDDATTAPDGNATADKIVLDGSAATTHYAVITIAEATFTDNAIVTYSVYLKEAELTWVRLELITKNANQQGCYFDLANGALGTAGGGITALIKEAANGFYRCSISMDINAGVTIPNFYIWLAEADNDVTIDGDSTSGIYIWGAQIEELPVPTSYIPTAGATASRATESGYPLWALPAGLFDTLGMCSVWWRPGYAFSDFVATICAIVNCSSAASPGLVVERIVGGAGKIYTQDATTTAIVGLNFAADTWYKLVAKWGYDVGGNEKYRVGYDSGAGIVWGAEINFDGEYNIGVNLLLAFGVTGPMWIRDLRLYDRILTDTEIDALGSP